MAEPDPRYASISPEERALWQRLLKAWNRGDVACHHELALTYTKHYPRNIAGWVTLAEVLISFARYEEAAAALRRASRLSRASLPHQVVVWTTLGRLCMERGSFSRAIRYYRQAAEVRPTTSALIFLGAALAKSGDLAAAKRCHQRAARLATANPDEAYYNLGLILRAERRYQKALAYLDLAIKHDPKYTLARQARTDCIHALRVKRHPSPGAPRRRAGEAG